MFYFLIIFSHLLVSYSVHFTKRTNHLDIILENLLFIYLQKIKLTTKDIIVVI